MVPMIPVYYVLSALHSAAPEGHSAQMRHLLEGNVDVNATEGEYA